MRFRTDFDGFDGFGYMGGTFGRAVFTIISGAAWILCLLILITLIFLLVRFLLVGTKAAQLYVANHSAPKSPAPSPTDAPIAPATEPTPPSGPRGTADPAFTEPTTTGESPTTPLPGIGQIQPKKPRTPRNRPTDGQPPANQPTTD